MCANNIQRSLFPILSLLTKVVFAFVLLIVVATSAMAYTVVFRDGHKIEVPTVFMVTTTTFTYEAAPGINRTVQLILIDVPATERVNNEAAGSFFKHAERNVVVSAPALTRRAQHTLTNLDLEPIRQRRIESEQNYEQRRIELGLPSIAETRRRQALEEESTLDLVRRRAAAEANDQAYWRGRAAALRNEIVTVDAEINYLRARFGQVRQVPFITQGFVTGAVPFGPFGGRSTMTQPGAGRLGTQAMPTVAPGLTNLGAVALTPSRPSRGSGFPRTRIGSSFPILPFVYNDNSYDSSIRLNDLLQRRAGLEALWRELENEARIAKVPQVWLAP
ncbi:MAG TPA: hypothetical protein VK582_16070 [Pyrinomonadaceae bacterium]|nr:hypothetical protein [Pyrinomonadaceae bacterium]